MNKNIPVVLVLIGLLFSGKANAQENPKDLNELINLAIENNGTLRAAKLDMEKSDALIGTAFEFDKTELYYSYDENNLTPSKSAT